MEKKDQVYEQVVGENKLNSLLSMLANSCQLSSCFEKFKQTVRENKLYLENSKLLSVLFALSVFQLRCLTKVKEVFEDVDLQNLHVNFKELDKFFEQEIVERFGPGRFRLNYYQYRCKFSIDLLCSEVGELDCVIADFIRQNENIVVKIPSLEIATSYLLAKKQTSLGKTLLQPKVLNRAEISITTQDVEKYGENKLIQIIKEVCQRVLEIKLEQKADTLFLESMDLWVVPSTTQDRIRLELLRVISKKLEECEDKADRALLYQEIPRLIIHFDYEDVFHRVCSDEDRKLCTELRSLLGNMIKRALQMGDIEFCIEVLNLNSTFSGFVLLPDEESILRKWWNYAGSGSRLRKAICSVKNLEKLSVYPGLVIQILRYLCKTKTCSQEDLDEVGKEIKIPDEVLKRIDPSLLKKFISKFVSPYGSSVFRFNPEIALQKIASIIIANAGRDSWLVERLTRYSERLKMYGGKPNSKILKVVIGKTSHYTLTPHIKDVVEAVLPEVDESRKRLIVKYVELLSLCARGSNPYDINSLPSRPEVDEFIGKNLRELSELVDVISSKLYCTQAAVDELTS